MLRYIMAPPITMAPASTIFRGPYLSTRNPSMGAKMLPSRRWRPNAPDTMPRLHPKVETMGVKKTCIP